MLIFQKKTKNCMCEFLETLSVACICISIACKESSVKLVRCIDSHLSSTPNQSISFWRKEHTEANTQQLKTYSSWYRSKQIQSKYVEDTGFLWNKFWVRSIQRQELMLLWSENTHTEMKQTRQCTARGKNRQISEDWDPTHQNGFQQAKS